MSYGLRLTSAAAVEPITTAQAKTHVRLDDDGIDTDLDDFFIPAARQAVEIYTDRQLVTATWTLTVPRFPYSRALYLPKGELQSVSSVKYYDTSDVQQTLSSDNYYVVTTAEPGCVYLKEDYSWPQTIIRPDAVEIIFVCGYGDAATDVPEYVRTVVAMHTAYLFEHRGEEAQQAVEDWLRISLNTYKLGDEWWCYGD